jgi:CubicO group peptidase (beta-lactamase class C family)
MTYPPKLAETEPQIEKSDLEKHGIDAERIDRLFTRVQADITRRLYPGAAVAIARGGTVVASGIFGVARTATPKSNPQAATPQTLWLLYSQSKPLVSCAIWMLVERGLLSFHEPIAAYLPKFVRHGKEKVTLYQLLTHQAGFPTANVSSSDAWVDHLLMREAVCDFKTEWEAGSKVIYHSQSAHWVQAALIEAVTGLDYRRFIQDKLLQPLGLNDTYIGVPDVMHERLAGSYERTTAGDHLLLPELNNTNFYRAGLPGTGAYATATDIALFYQMLLGLCSLQGERVLAPRTVQYATRNHTGSTVDEYFGIPMHRGLGVHLRGDTPSMYGLGSTAGATTFGHGGMGTSYSWADPETGVSFTYLTNSRLSGNVHTRRLEEIMTLAHSSVIRL